MMFQYMLLLRGATRAMYQIHSKMVVSIHAPLARSNAKRKQLCASSTFQYMLLLRGATGLPDEFALMFLFQYMLLLRGATGNVQQHNQAKAFQYMLLLRGATSDFKYELIWKKFQYMLLLRGATLTELQPNVRTVVSIHAPLARSNQ